MPTEQQSPPQIDTVTLVRGMASLLTTPPSRPILNMVTALLDVFCNLTNYSQKLSADLQHARCENHSLEQKLLEANKELQDLRKQVDPLELDDCYELLMEVRQALKDAKHTDLITRIDALPIIRRRR